MTVESFQETYCTESNAIPELGDLLRLEQQIGYTLPQEYRDYLLKVNGGPYAGGWITLPDGRIIDVVDEMFGVRARHPSLDLLNSDCQHTELLDEGFLYIGKTPRGWQILLGIDHADAEIYGVVFLKGFNSIVGLADDFQSFWKAVAAYDGSVVQLDEFGDVALPLED